MYNIIYMKRLFILYFCCNIYALPMHFLGLENEINEGKLEYRLFGYIQTDNASIMLLRIYEFFANKNILSENILPENVSSSSPSQQMIVQNNNQSNIIARSFVANSLQNEVAVAEDLINANLEKIKELYEKYESKNIIDEKLDKGFIEIVIGNGKNLAKSEELLELFSFLRLKTETNIINNIITFQGDKLKLLIDIYQIFFDFGDFEYYPEMQAIFQKKRQRDSQKSLLLSNDVQKFSPKFITFCMDEYDIEKVKDILLFFSQEDYKHYYENERKFYVILDWYKYFNEPKHEESFDDTYGD